MFARHYDHMFGELQSDSKGASIVNMYTGNPTYADGVSVATFHKLCCKKNFFKCMPTAKDGTFT